MRHIVKLLATAAVLGGLSLAPARAGSLDGAQKKEVEELIRSYLLEHPEILREMSAGLEAKERIAEETVRAKTLTENAAAIFKSGIDPVVGNPGGDVTIVEFMDYNCSWCKKGMKEIAAIVEADKNVRVVFKEFPIFGAGSEFAARAAIAASRQGKYWELHRALFAHDGPVTQEVTLQLAEELGLDLARLDTDMKDPAIAKSLGDNQALAVAMQINGTPAFIVDDKVFPGYVPKDALLSAIAGVREKGGCKLC